MTPNSNVTPSAHGTSPIPVLPSHSLLMPQDPSSSPPEWSDPEQKPNRDLAWRVAPNLIVSFKYAWAGVRYAFITQRNFRIHTGICFVAVSLGIFLKIAAVEMAVIGLTCALVLVLELLNTALESVVDLTVKQSYHALAKIAKDCAAGAVLISAIAAVFVASWLLIPPLYAKIVLSWG